MKNFLLILLPILFVSCSIPLKKESEEKKEITLQEFELDNITDAEKILEIDEVKEALEKTRIDSKEIEELIEKPMYEFTPEEIDDYLKFVYELEPDLRKRVNHFARKFIGQNYEIYLLGEFPFEIYDPQPLYSIDKSDCVVFSEHVYAMALSNNWKKFFAMLQRIRYKDGVIGLLTRNHYTEADWTVNNSWLIKDITDSLPGVKSKSVVTKIDRANFFKKWGIGQDIPVQELSWSYIPASEVPKALKYLKTGDFVNVVRGYTPDDVYVGHVGIISVGSDGVVYLIHSTEPEVKMEPLLEYMKRSIELNKTREKENQIITQKNAEILKYNQQLRASNNGNPHPDEKKLLSLKPIFYGFRFFELQENALENLQKLDGPKAPKVTIFGEN
ncbi:MAG: N-acetylmuramoyl-L-alanine amidase-like domain-containing protein [Ignavibacteria bacterium]